MFNRKKTGPVTYQDMRDQLGKHPDKFLSIFSGVDKDVAKSTAIQMNLGLNPLNEEFPTSIYFFIFAEFDGRWDVLAGLRPNIPDEWRKFVTGE